MTDPGAESDSTDGFAAKGAADDACVLVTGGAGFIGGNLVRLLVRECGVRVVNLDKLTYAGNLESLADLEGEPRHAFVRGDVADAELVRHVFDEFRPRAVLHLAAESHVDRSIDAPGAFIETNLLGTYTLLEAVRRHLGGVTSAEAERFRFVGVSTDEVYGSLGEEGRFSEETRYDPSSPYAASKAGADHLVRAYQRTYGLPALVTNCSNNYGPYQFPEKLIPLVITRAVSGEALPVYGRGQNVRDWIYVEDHCRALWTVLERGAPGRTYNVGGGEERRNLEVVETICAHLDRLVPPSSRGLGVGSYAELIRFVTDRPGHDFRYAIDDARLRGELGWRPRETFATGIEKTVRWYLDHPDWCAHVTSGAYRDWIDKHYARRDQARTPPG